MPFINTTGSIGTIIAHGTNGVTGSLVITLLLVLILMIVIGIMFGMALEYIGIFILPLCLACAAYYNTMLAPLGILIIYFATLITKHWLFK